MADKTMDAYEERDAELDEELAEVLIAISVISKRLAKKITAKNMTKEAKEDEPKTYKDVEVRAALGEKAKVENKKYKPEVKALVEKYSNDGTFTGIPADKYTELMTELEGIGNG